MDYKKISKRELIAILDVVHSAVFCRTEADIKQVLEKAKELVCGDYSICGVGSYSNQELPGIKKAINGNYPQEWLYLHNGDKLYEKAPGIWHQSKFSGVQLWAETYKKYKNKISSDFVGKSGDFGLNFGISGGIKSPYDALASIITFFRRKNYFTQHEKEIMDIVVPHLHQALVRICGGKINSRLPYLTKREQEVLNWTKEGKTDWEISMILNIGERTVKFHIQNIKRKLNAVNKAQAIAIAFEHGLIH